MIFFYNIKHANLNADADDHQLYSSNKDLETLNRRLRHEIRISNSWYKQNGKIVNTEKDQEMVLGTDSNYEFSFSVKNSIDLLGVTIDKDLSFNHHISQICGKVNNQFSVLKRLKNISRNAMLRLGLFFYHTFNIALSFGNLIRILKQTNFKIHFQR